MSTKRLPVVAVIPNYNMAEALGELLSVVAEQDYAEIFVVDDASTDHSRDVVRDFDRGVRFIQGAENVGAGANRNRIIGALAHKSLIHFLDADMQLASERTPELAQDLASSEHIGFVGGLVRRMDGEQNGFNYGPRISLHTYIGALVQYRIYSALGDDRDRAAYLRQHWYPYVKDFPDPTTDPVARRVFWALEGNLLIRSELFEAMNGFDPRLRCSEIQDLAIRQSQMGLERRFDPLLEGIHTAVMVRRGNRGAEWAKAEARIARTYGIRNFFRPDGQFEPSL